MGNNWKVYLKNDAIEWLLESNPWTKYRTLVDLLDKPENDLEVIEAKKQLLENHQISKLISDASQWFPTLPKRHDDAKMSHYKLRMLSDFGLKYRDNGIADILSSLKVHKENNLFAIKQGLPERNKETVEGEDTWHALPCDSTLLTYILMALGDRSDDVIKTLEILINEWEKKEGWFCHLFFVSGQYKKLQVACPMAGLQFLEILSLLDSKTYPNHVINAFEPLRFHRDYKKSLYYFGRSKRFWSFKYPYVWYNALYVGDVLTRFEAFRDEALLGEIIEWIVESQDDQGKYTPTSMYREYKGWDFANKKEPSPWMTFLAYRILKRYYDHKV